MKIVEPSAEIITECSPLQRIEYAARTCYKSRNKITKTSARPFVEGLVKRGHGAALEHARIVVDSETLNGLGWLFAKENKGVPYGLVSRMIHSEDQKKAALNVRDFLAIGGKLDDVNCYGMASDYMTVEFVCDIGVSRELCRHRQMSFMEQSTRYVNFKDGIEFIEPLIVSQDAEWKRSYWFNSCVCSEKDYQQMIERGCSPQIARSVLPLSTATRIIVTGMFSQWEDVFKLRLAPDAHPQMVDLMMKLISLPDFPKNKIKLPTWRPTWRRNA